MEILPKKIKWVHPVGYFLIVQSWFFLLRTKDYVRCTFWNLLGDLKRFKLYFLQFAFEHVGSILNAWLI